MFRMVWHRRWALSMENKNGASAVATNVNEPEIEMAQFRHDANGRAKNDKWTENSFKQLTKRYRIMGAVEWR